MTTARRPQLDHHDRPLDRDTALTDISSAIVSLTDCLADLAGSNSASVEASIHQRLQRIAARVDSAAQGFAPVVREAVPPHFSEIRRATYIQELEHSVRQMSEDTGKLREAINLATAELYDGYDGDLLKRIDDMLPADDWENRPEELGL